MRREVEADPQGHVTLPRPVLVDEHLRFPPLLGHIKAQLNKDGAPDRFVLTGSASADANRRGLNALVGRYTSVPVLPLAQSEIEGHGGNFLEKAFDDVEWIRSSGPSATPRESYVDRVVTGGFPLMVRSLDAMDRYQRFTHYVEQSINYGMANLSEVRERESLEQLLHRYAAQTGQLLNIQKAARDVGLKRSSAENYTRLLELLFLIFRLPAWKATDRGPVSRPKLYVVDSGVAGRLQRLTPERIQAGEPLDRGRFGHLLETFVVGEVRKLLSWMRIPGEIGYWRNRRGDEIDLVVERPPEGSVIGIEVKAASRVAADDWKGLRLLRDELGPRFRAGLVLHLGEMPHRLDDRIYTVPVDKLWAGTTLAVTDRKPVSARERITVGERAAGEGLLTADGDPLPEPVRLAAEEMIDRMGIGEAAYWEVAAVPPAIVHFGDFYTTAGVAGALHGYHAWPGGETEPINQCVAVVRRPSPSPLGYVGPGVGALVHPLGPMVFVVSAFPDPPLHRSQLRFISQWADDLTGFTYKVLSPHASAWTIWSAGRRMRSGSVRFAGADDALITSGGQPTPGRAVVDNPPHRGIPARGGPESEARLLRASFYEWFGIPAAELPATG